LVIENQAVPPAPVELSRLVLHVVALAVDGPPIEAAGAAVDLPNRHGDGLVGLRSLAVFAEHCVIPRLLRWLDPARRPALVGVFDDDAHSVLAIVILRRSQNPDSRVLHF